LPSTRTGKPRSPKDILSSGLYHLKDLFEIWPKLKLIPEELHTQIETDCIYNVYLKRQKEDIKMYRQENKITIPINFDFNLIKGLSNEIKDILNQNKPSTVAQASRLPGFTPTATLLLLRHLKREKKYKVVNEH
jgi:tRNA uridine 5-carboxymethylaminomethyl modification enzyme